MPSEVPPTSSESGASASDATSGEKRTGAGKETMDIFNFEDENVRRVCEKLFTEQMDMGEAYLEDS
ncbi:Protein CBG15379 [Caenorhabditis briggsae]|uniref:Protein CBG15379 n=1 Tax=Caenorhabditis briggsae TaxID=6238 RepID=A8XM23_CAEBR|nr:Protein CBG15379 [Caenorhabditis briggsae]CAP33698.2 Protein CBG15379 [Caenorhabditis briggsae]